MAATTTVPPCLTTSPATNPMRRMLRSRSSREKDSSLDRWVRTTSPSRTVTGRPPASSSATGASAIVDLPAPDRPVRKTATPPCCALLTGRVSPSRPGRSGGRVPEGAPGVGAAAHPPSRRPGAAGGGAAGGARGVLAGGRLGHGPRWPPGHDVGQRDLLEHPPVG